VSGIRATLLLSLAVSPTLVACGDSPTNQDAVVERLLLALEEVATGDRGLPVEEWPHEIPIAYLVMDHPAVLGPVPNVPIHPTVQALADAGTSAATALTAYLLSEERSILGRRLALQGIRVGRIDSAPIVDSLHRLAAHADDALAFDAHLTVARIAPGSERTWELFDRSWGSPRETVRAGAARAVPLLGRAGRARFVPRLIERLNEICVQTENAPEDASWVEQEAVLRAVSEIGAEASAALGCVVRMARVADSPALMIELARALGGLGTEEAWQAMFALGASESSPARLVAVLALPAVRRPAAARAALVALALEASEDMDWMEARVHFGVLAELGEGGRAVESTARRLTTHPDPDISFLARRWLERMGLDD
jgi:hypothetical protein